MIRYRSNQGFRLGLVGYLIITNLILYIAVSIQPETFISVFGLQTISFWERPWTIVTNMFIHSPFPDIGHILANMITLYFFGSVLARLLGERYFLLIYLCGGLVGNLLYMVMANPYSIAIGASGAVFAVAGALTLLRPDMRVMIFPLPVPLPLWVAVIGGFLLFTVFSIAHILPIAWQAHLGGLVFGMAAAFFFRKKQRYFF